MAFDHKKWGGPTVLENAKTYKQYLQYFANNEANRCPFCQLDPSLNKVIRQCGEWRIWENPFPEKHTSNHLVGAPIKHIQHLQHMTDNDWKSAQTLIDWAATPEIGYGLLGGALIMRFGPTHLNAGSVRHLHFNIIVPDGTGEVRIPLAKKPEDIEKKKRIIAIFEKMRLGDTVTNDEMELVKDRLD